MLEVKGKFNTAKIFTDVVDETSMAQVTFLQFVQEMCHVLVIFARNLKK